MAGVGQSGCVDFGKAVQILGENKKKKLLELDHDTLKSVLCHPSVADKPISVISIVGAYRTGKSFLLNFILRYLQNRGHENENWIGSGDQDLNGFSWSSGEDPNTHGVWMWSKPFIIKTHRTEVAVFLVDTEGNFDLENDEEQNQISVILSMLLSSVMVFNISKRMNLSDAKFLEFCVKYSRRTNRGQHMCPLQTLRFLIRDWSDPDNYSYGTDGGREYLRNKILDSGRKEKSAAMARIGEELEQSFESTECFLMPEPLGHISDNDFSGALKGIDDRKGFIKNLKIFCDTVANPDNLILKKNITGHELMTLLIANFECLEENQGKLLNPREYRQLKEDIDASESFYKCGVEFGRKLDKALESGYMPTEEFEKTRKEIWVETRNEFYEKLTEGLTFFEKLLWSTTRQEKRLEKYVALRHVERCKMANSIAELKGRSAAENAQLVVIVYETRMKEAMSGVHRNDWETQLNHNHKHLAKEAKKGYDKREDEKKFKKETELMNAGINCAKELLKLEGPIKRGAYKHERNKLISDSIEQYVREWHRRRVAANPETNFHGVARNKALEHFGREISEESEQDRKRLIEIMDALSEKEEYDVNVDAAVERNEKINKVKVETHFFEYKKKVLEEIKQYAQCIRAVFHGSKLDEVLGKKKRRYNEEMRELRSNLKCSKEVGLGATEEVMTLVEAAFAAIKERDQSLKPFGDRLLKLDVKIRKLWFLQTIGEKLEDSYAVPDVLDDLFRIALDELLPKEDEEDDCLKTHRKEVKEALDELMDEFKVWNEENKSNFNRVTSRVVGGLGVAGAGAVGGGTAALFFADTAIVTTVGAAVATGVGAALVGGVAIAGGAFLSYRFVRKKAGNKHVDAEIKKIEEEKA